MEQDYILSSRLLNNWDKDGAGIVYFVLAVDCLITGTRMEQDYILSSRLCNSWDKDGAGIIYFV